MRSGAVFIILIGLAACDESKDRPADPVAAAKAEAVAAGTEAVAAGTQAVAAGQEAVEVVKAIPGKPVSCSGSKEITVDGASINAGSSPAVVASGSCQVTITGSQLTSDLVAVDVSGSADVTIRGSVVIGKVAAISLSGSASVTAKDTRFVGRKSVTGSADWTDQGGNKFE